MRWLLVLVVTATTAVAQAPQPASLCLKGEKVVFACRMAKGDKMVSLCASADLAEDAGHLQYRFGRPGAVELQYPRDRKGSAGKFKYAHYFRFQVDRTELSFDNAGVVYEIYDYYDGEEKPATRETGVRVKDVALACRKPVTNSMGSLAGIVPCDEDNALGGCR